MKNKNNGVKVSFKLEIKSTDDMTCENLFTQEHSETVV